MIKSIWTYGSGSLQSVSSKMAFKVPSQPGDHRSMMLAMALRDTCAGRHLEEEDERLEESLEVVNIIEAPSYLDVLEEAHPEDGEDEHDEEEEEADVEEGGHGHDEGEEEGADTLRTLDQPQHTTHLEDGQCKVHIFLNANPTFATLTTLSSVGLTKYFSIRSLRNSPA